MTPADRATLRAGLRRALRRAQPEDFDELLDQLQVQIEDYRWREDAYPRMAAARPGAQAFAETVSTQVASLQRLIRRRWKAILSPPHGRSVNHETAFTIHVRNRMLPLLKEWKAMADAEVTSHTREARRPVDEPRLRLGCGVADALERAGLRLSTAVLTRTLEEAIYPAIGLSDRGARSLARSARASLEEWRTLPMHSRHLPRVARTTR